MNSSCGEVSTLSWEKGFVGERKLKEGLEKGYEIFKGWVWPWEIKWEIFFFFVVERDAERHKCFLAGWTVVVDNGYNGIAIVCFWHLVFSRGFLTWSSLWRSWKGRDNVTLHGGTREVLHPWGDLLT